MNSNKKYNIIMTALKKDVYTLLDNFKMFEDNLDFKKIIVISKNDVKDLLLQYNITDKVEFIDEEELVKFDDVYNSISKIDEHSINTTGWYLQQFLKMEYARRCEDEYYIIWDADTIPIRKYIPFSEKGNPIFDLKYEYHVPYFDTMSRLINGLHKNIEGSFVSEHMIINTEIMKKLLRDIESNIITEGTFFWEKILLSIEKSEIDNCGFSEFETYGTYCAIFYPNMYEYRQWNSLRSCSKYFRLDNITERDYNWISKDFDAVSFESYHKYNWTMHFIMHNVIFQRIIRPSTAYNIKQKLYQNKATKSLAYKLKI